MIWWVKSYWHIIIFPIKLTKQTDLAIRYLLIWSRTFNATTIPFVWYFFSIFKLILPDISNTHGVISETLFESSCVLLVVHSLDFHPSILVLMLDRLICWFYNHSKICNTLDITSHFHVIISISFEFKFIQRSIVIEGICYEAITRQILSGVWNKEQSIVKRNLAIITFITQSCKTSDITI